MEFITALTMWFIAVLLYRIGNKLEEIINKL